MSADNYIKVKRFGENDYRWGMWFMSNDNPDFSDEKYNHGPFKTPLEAANDAQKEVDIIEYGIDYHPNCLIDVDGRDYKEKIQHKKLKASVIFVWEYEVNPKHYDTNDPEEMAEIDRGWAKEDIFSFLEGCSEEPKIKIVPVEV